MTNLLPCTYTSFPSASTWPIDPAMATHIPLRPISTLNPFAAPFVPTCRPCHANTGCSSQRTGQSHQQRRGRHTLGVYVRWRLGGNNMPVRVSDEREDEEERGGRDPSSRLGGDRPRSPDSPPLEAVNDTGTLQNSDDEGSDKWFSPPTSPDNAPSSGGLESISEIDEAALELADSGVLVQPADIDPLSSAIDTAVTAQDDERDDDDDDVEPVMFTNTPVATLSADRSSADPSSPTAESSNASDRFALGTRPSNAIAIKVPIPTPRVRVRASSGSFTTIPVRTVQSGSAESSRLLSPFAPARTTRTRRSTVEDRPDSDMREIESRRTPYERYSATVEDDSDPDAPGKTTPIPRSTGTPDLRPSRSTAPSSPSTRVDSPAPSSICSDRSGRLSPTSGGQRLGVTGWKKPPTGPRHSASYRPTTRKTSETDGNAQRAAGSSTSEDDRLTSMAAPSGRARSRKQSRSTRALHQQPHPQYTIPVPTQWSTPPFLAEQQSHHQTYANAKYHGGATFYLAPPPSSPSSFSPFALPSSDDRIVSYIDFLLHEYDNIRCLCLNLHNKAFVAAFSDPTSNEPERDLIRPIITTAIERLNDGLLQLIVRLWRWSGEYETQGGRVRVRNWMMTYPLSEQEPHELRSKPTGWAIYQLPTIHQTLIGGSPYFPVFSSETYGLVKIDVGNAFDGFWNQLELLYVGCDTYDPIVWTSICRRLQDRQPVLAAMPFNGLLTGEDVANGFVQAAQDASDVPPYSRTPLFRGTPQLWHDYKEKNYHKESNPPPYVQLARPTHVISTI